MHDQKEIVCVCLDKSPTLQPSLPTLLLAYQSVCLSSVSGNLAAPLQLICVTVFSCLLIEVDPTVFTSSQQTHTHTYRSACTQTLCGFGFHCVATARGRKCCLDEACSAVRWSAVPAGSRPARTADLSNTTCGNTGGLGTELWRFLFYQALTTSSVWLRYDYFGGECIIPGKIRLFYFFFLVDATYILSYVWPPYV